MPLFYGFGDFGGSEGISRNNPFNPFGIEFCDLTGFQLKVKLVMMPIIQVVMP